MESTTVTLGPSSLTSPGNTAEGATVLLRSHAHEAAVRLSIIICSRNRAGSITPTLEALSLAISRVENGLVEAVIIDSESTDNTSNVLVDWGRHQAFPVTVARANIKGTSRARNIGIKLSKGDIVAVTDDDCHPDPDYAKALLVAFPNLAIAEVIGGRIDLGDPSDLPLTIKPDDEPSELSKKRMPSGFIMSANMAFNREAFKVIGLFDERLGPGAPLVAAEDCDMVIRAMLKEVRVRYDPNIKVKHFHGRKFSAEALKLLESYSFGDGAVMAKYLFVHPFVFRRMISIFLLLMREVVSPPALDYTKAESIMGPRKTWWRIKHQLRGANAYFKLDRNVSAT
jgi:glycosyltransferase involved in cell wall biosynthesis